MFKWQLHEEKAIWLSKHEYKKLIHENLHLIDFLGASPLVGVELDLQRDQSLDRLPQEVG